MCPMHPNGDSVPLPVDPALPVARSPAAPLLLEGPGNAPSPPKLFPLPWYDIAPRVFSETSVLYLAVILR